MEQTTIQRPVISHPEPDFSPVQSGEAGRIFPRLGWWTAIILAGLNGLYMLMVLASLTTDTSDLQLLSALPVVLALPAVLIQLGVLEYVAPISYKGLARFGLACGTGYVVFAGFTYLTQLTVVRQNITKPQYENYLLQDLQNQNSLAAVTDMAGYFFLGLALLAAATILSKREGHSARWSARLLRVGGVLGVIATLCFTTGWQTFRYLALVGLVPCLLFGAISLAFFYRNLFDRAVGIGIREV